VSGWSANIRYIAEHCFSYTMQGDLELSQLSAPKDSAGIVPRVLHRLYTLLESGPYLEYAVKCSYIELYNEELRDLLSADYDPVTAAQRQPMAMTSTVSNGLKLYDDGKKGVMIQGLEEVGSKTLQEALNLLNKGCQRRQVAETKMNTESS
jgi:kinesin family protein 11